MLATLPASVHGPRDRALLLLGFISAFRPSGLVELDVADLVEDRSGLIVFLRKSKADQQGFRHLKAIPHGVTSEMCPVRAVRAWLEAASITAGPLFRGIDRHGAAASSPVWGLRGSITQRRGGYVSNRHRRVLRACNESLSKRAEREPDPAVDGIPIHTRSKITTITSFSNPGTMTAAANRSTVSTDMGEGALVTTRMVR